MVTVTLSCRTARERLKLVCHPANAQPPTIMVVDDNPVGRMLLTKQLEWLGHAVTQHDSPASCLRAGNPTAGRGDHRLQHARDEWLCPVAHHQ